MPALYNQIIIGYRDQEGKECASFWTATDLDPGPAAAYATLAGLVQAISDAAVIGVQFQSTLLLDGEASDGPYNTIQDRAAFLSSIPATSKPLTLQFVAPKASLFLPDTVTLDLSNTDLIAVQSEMMPLVGDTAGNAMGPIRRGYRTMARNGL